MRKKRKKTTARKKKGVKKRGRKNKVTGLNFLRTEFGVLREREERKRRPTQVHPLKYVHTYTYLSNEGVEQQNRSWVKKSSAMNIYESGRKKRESDWRERTMRKKKKALRSFVG